MMQVWLVLLGGLILHEASKMNDRIADAVRLLGWGIVALSVVLVFVNGGTTG